MSESTEVIEGVIVPLLTTVDEEERVDEPAMRALIRHCLEGGVNGIFVGGTSGFGPLLTDDQWERLMEIARDEVDDSVPLLGGVIATSTVRAIERIRVLDRIGFKHMVVTATFYVTPTREDYLRPVAANQHYAIRSKAAVSRRFFRNSADILCNGSYNT